MTDTTTLTRQQARSAATVIHDVVHDGHRIVVQLVPAWDERREVSYDGRTYLSGSYQPAPRLEATVDGRHFHVGTQDADKVLAKAKRDLDTAKANAELLPRLRAVISTPGTEPTGTMATNGVRVGDIAWTYAQGRRRRGIVTKVGRTNVTVAYTTASAPTNVYRPSRAADEVLVERAAR